MTQMRPFWSEKSSIICCLVVNKLHNDSVYINMMADGFSGTVQNSLMTKMSSVDCEI